MSTEGETFDEAHEALKKRVLDGDLGILDLWNHYERLHRIAGRPEPEAGTVAYCYALLEPWDNYGSGDLTVCAREIARVIPELHNRIAELLVQSSSLENERRGWKSRALASRKLIESLVAMMLSRFGADDAAAEATRLVRAVSDRNDLLEADAWCKAVALVRDFVKDSDQLMGDYAPDHVAPSEGKDPKSHWIARWRDRFKEALG